MFVLYCRPMGPKIFWNKLLQSMWIRLHSVRANCNIQAPCGLCGHWDFLTLTLCFLLLTCHVGGVSGAAGISLIWQATAICTMCIIAVQGLHFHWMTQWENSGLHTLPTQVLFSAGSKGSVVGLFNLNLLWLQTVWHREWDMVLWLHILFYSLTVQWFGTEINRK